MIKRNLIPGSEWLYIKLYTGMKSADKILSDVIKPFAKQLRSDGLITDYFFIRYTDPRFHIRLRLRLTDNNSFNGVMQQFLSYFEELNRIDLIYDIQFGIYKREMSRYGENTIEIIESIFCNNSEMVIDLIEQLRENGDSDKHRWLLALVLVDNLLDNVGFNLESKAEFLSMISDSFKKEFGIDSSRYTKPLNDKYRENRKQIESFLRREDDYLQFDAIFINHNKLIDTNAKKLLYLCNEGENMKINELLPSITHMAMNRLFRSNNRLYEMVVYYLLNKHYASQIALSKQNKKE